MLNKIKSHMNERTIFKLSRVANHAPYFYFGTVICTALLGYIVLLSSPLLALYSIHGLQQAVSADVLNYGNIVLWTSLIIMGVAVTYHTVTIKFDNRIGIPLSEDKAPELYELIENCKPIPSWLCAKIDQVHLSEKHELKFVKVPVTGIPLWSKNNLVIGLSFMQSLPKNHFDQAITGRIAQLIRHRHPVTYWLASLCDLWAQYPKALRNRDKFGDQLLADFFSWYAPLYKRIAIHVVQKTQLYNDDYNLNIYNDQDVAEAIQAEATTSLYITQYYWPHIRKALRSPDKPSPTSLAPFNKMGGALKAKLNARTLRNALVNIYSNAALTPLEQPSLKRRIENLGHTQLVDLHPWANSAAEIYLGKNHNGYVNLIEKYWVAKQLGNNNSAPQKKKQKVRSKKTVAPTTKQTSAAEPKPLVFNTSKPAARPEQAA